MSTPEPGLHHRTDRRFRCTMRVDCGELDPGAVIQAVSGEWHPRMPEQLALRGVPARSWGRGRVGIRPRLRSGG